MARVEPNLDDIRLLRLAEVLKCVPVSKTTLYRMIKESKFPKGVLIGNGTVAWPYSEVQAYVNRAKRSRPRDDAEDII